MLAELLGHEPPDGLRGALERVGHSPLRQPSLYGRLVQVFTIPEQRPLVAVLRHVGQITGTMLRVADVLPDVLLHPAVLTRVDCVPEAVSLIEALNFVRSVNTRLNDEVLTEALNRMPESAGIEDVLNRFVRRADLQLGQPLPADDEVRPLLKVRDMITLSREFRNCLAEDRKLRVALLERAAYAVLRDEVVMEFTKLSTGSWLFIGVHGRRNGPIPDNMLEVAKAKCTVAGVPFVTRGEGRMCKFGQFFDPLDPMWMDLAA